MGELVNGPFRINLGAFLRAPSAPHGWGCGR